MRHSIPARLLPLLSTLLLTGSAAGGQPPDEKAIAALTAEALKAWDVPGAVVVVVRPDRTAYLGGSGVRELGKDAPMTPDTLFPLASCSKAFTTALIGMLADEGKLAWDDPVRKHLPDFKLADPLADANVTLRDLCCHRTGLGGHDLLWYRAAWGPEEMVRRAGLLPPDASFRSTFQYQSVMFTAAGLAAGRAAGGPWGDLVRKRLLAPLGMKSAGCKTAEADPAARATGHRPDRDGKLRPVEWYPVSEPNPAGSVHVSGRDLANWLRFQLGDGTFDGKRLISSAALEETHTPQIVQRMDDEARATHPETVQMSYGLGWVIQDYRGRPQVSHAGIIDGFRIHLTLLPRDGWGVAVLANRHATRMNLALSNRLVDELLGVPPRDWNALHLGLARKEEEEARERAAKRARDRRPNTRPSAALPAFAGAYEHPAYGRGQVRQERGALRWEWGNWRSPLEHYQDNVFTLREELLNDPPVEFAVDFTGAVTAMRAFGVTFQRVRGGG
jgi:CubicO group peptidase (beta-lactamase class C family)